MKYITEGYQGSMFFWLNNHDGMMAFPLDHEEELPVKTQHARKQSPEGLPPYINRRAPHSNSTVSIDANGMKRSWVRFTFSIFQQVPYPLVEHGLYKSWLSFDIAVVKEVTYPNATLLNVQWLAVLLTLDFKLVHASFPR